jgi:hypothetical protein
MSACICFLIHCTNRVGGCPLFEQLSSHTTVRTVRYTAMAVQWIACSTSYYLPIPDSHVITGNRFVHTVSVRAFQYLNALHSLSFLGFHPPSLKSAGSLVFCFHHAVVTFHSLVSLSSFGPSHSVRSPSTRDFPLYGTMVSADFLHLSYTVPHRFFHGQTVRQSPYKVCARPPRVRASNLHPM